MKHESGLDDLKIDKIDVPDPEYMSEVPEHMKKNNFPGFPSTTLICGPPGRGKTNLLINLLTKKQFWYKFFDTIYAYGPTVKSDKLYKTIKLQPQNIVDDVKEIIPDLEKKLDEQTKKIEGDPGKAPKVLFLFEDMTSFFNTVQHKPAFHRCYTQVRHLKGASVTMVHKYHAFHRTPRTSSQHILIFETNQIDLKHLYDEFGPRSLSFDEFLLMASFALQATPEAKKPFFYINNNVDERIRYRRCFTDIMEIRPMTLYRQPTPKRSGRKRSQKREPANRERSPSKYDYNRDSAKERRD